MTVFELTVAVLLAIGGLRSLVYWARRPVESPRVADHVAFALWVTGRVGLWFAIAGIFAISASISGDDDVGFLTRWGHYRWYVMVPIGLAAIQVIAAHLLRRLPPE